MAELLTSFLYTPWNIVLSYWLVLQIATLRSAQEEAFHRQMKEQVELAEDAEVAKLMDARDRAMQQKAAQMQQLEEMKARILADRAANKAEVCSGHFVLMIVSTSSLQKCTRITLQ